MLKTFVLKRKQITTKWCSNEALKKATGILMDHLQIVSNSLPEGGFFTAESVKISQPEEFESQTAASDEDTVYSKKIEGRIAQNKEFWSQVTRRD